MIGMERRVVHTDAAPKAIGPYSQAIVLGDLVFCSGQIPLDPATGAMIEGDVAAETERVMQNLHAVLAAAGSSLAKVVKTTIFLTDLGDFAVVNEIYGRYVGTDAPPARATVQVAALPRGARVEVEAIAHV